MHRSDTPAQAHGRQEQTNAVPEDRPTWGERLEADRDTEWRPTGQAGREARPRDLFGPVGDHAAAPDTAEGTTVGWVGSAFGVRADRLDPEQVRPLRGEQAPEAAGMPPTVPIEGPGFEPLAGDQPRPRVEWRAGDLPVDPGDLGHRNLVVHVRGDLVRPAQADSGLGTTHAWPDGSHTAQEKQDMIQEGRRRAAEAVGRENWSNAKYAGDIFSDKLSDRLQQRFPHGVPFSYEGFPVFDHYAPVTVRFDDGFAPARENGRADRPADERRANEIFGWRFTPKGMTWHHKEDGRTMLLVDAQLHDWVRHWGGERVTRVRMDREAGNASD